MWVYVSIFLLSSPNQVEQIQKHNILNSVACMEPFPLSFILSKSKRINTQTLNGEMSESSRKGSESAVLVSTLEPYYTCMYNVHILYTVWYIFYIFIYVKSLYNNLLSLYTFSVLHVERDVVGRSMEEMYVYMYHGMNYNIK